MPNEGGVGFSAIFDQYVVISRKWCILDTKLLWDGNRKPYAGYRMVSVSMTLSDTWPRFQGHGSFKRRISPKRRILQTQFKGIWLVKKKQLQQFSKVLPWGLGLIWTQFVVKPFFFCTQADCFFYSNSVISISNGSVVSLMCVVFYARQHCW